MAQLDGRGGAVGEPPKPLPSLAVDLWFSPLIGRGPDAGVEEGLGWLSASERQRYSRFGSEMAARRFLLGRTMIRRVVGEALDVQPGSLGIELEDGGKPRIRMAEEAGLAFNISHDGDDVVLAVARCRSIGVDLVSMSRRRQAARIAAHFFPAPERAQLAGAGDAVALRSLQLWALKESAAKVEGVSVWAALPRFAFTMDAEQNPADGVGLRHWIGTYAAKSILALSCRMEDSVPGGGLALQAHAFGGGSLPADAVQALGHVRPLDL